MNYLAKKESILSSNSDIQNKLFENIIKEYDSIFKDNMELKNKIDLEKKIEKNDNKKKKANDKKGQIVN